MTTAAHRLAEFAAGLSYERIPPEVIERAKDCLIDTVAACVFGAELPWTRAVVEYARRNSARGGCSVIGTAHQVRAPFACLANGASAHAFELDCLCEPSVGIHPSAALAVPALAAAQGRRLDGRALLAALVAGYEVLYRIGDAANHAIEKNGFHSPGVVGPFGTAVVIGRLFGLDAGRLAHALGIAGSMGAGLMEFSNTGGMVKRLHLGRAAESGFLAAVLARDGYTGPAGVLEGRFGFLNAYCGGGEPARLTRDLGAVWHTMKNKIKRYACHSTAQVPVTLALALKEEHGLAGEDIAGVTIAASEKTVSQHAIPEPRDLTMMQYSVPFCVALAFYSDPLDPRSFSERALNDPRIRALARGARVERLGGAAGYLSQACRVTVKLKNGRELCREGSDYRGTPSSPLTREELREKFLRLTAHRDRAKAEPLFEQLAQAEQVEDFSTLDLAL
ncbi:MAG TPA: MmgE/PrpD family protein [Burkholderiales bacterium]|nr:MmgE/PrpD family protein [Burkholderiales bacterium]